MPGFASGRRQDRVPWKQIKAYTADFIDDRYLPDSIDGAAVIEDPSHMKKEQITRLLNHWKRPVPGSDLFRFSHVLVNSKTDSMTPALYEDSLGPIIRPQNGGVITDAPTPIGGGASDWDAEYASGQGLRATPPVGDDVNMNPNESDLMPTTPDFEPELAALLWPGAQDDNVLPQVQSPVIDPILMGLRWPPQVQEGSLLQAPKPSVSKPPGKKSAAKPLTSKPSASKPPGKKSAAKLLTSKKTSKAGKQASVPQPNESALPVELAPPKGCPRPKPKAPAIVATRVDNPEMQPAQNPIGGAKLPTKRVPKRKLDIYVAALAVAEELAAEKRQRRK